MNDYIRLSLVMACYGTIWGRMPMTSRFLTSIASTNQRNLMVAIEVLGMDQRCVCMILCWNNVMG